jgi:hypothetical protein
MTVAGLIELGLSEPEEKLLENAKVPPVARLAFKRFAVEG